jgi:hypothetical protein
LKVKAEGVGPWPGIEGIVDAAVQLGVLSLVIGDGEYILAIGADL